MCNGVIPQLLWSRKIRTSVVPLFAVCMVVNVGMWLERFLIIVPSLGHKYLPYSFGRYSPEPVEIIITAATLMTSGPLLVAFLLFQRQFVQRFMRAGIR